MRQLVVVACLVLVVGACSADTNPSKATVEKVTSVSTEATTTTTSAEPTSTTVAEAVDICRKGTLWELGTTYLADCFLVPISFEPQDEGWRSSRANEQVVFGSWREPGQASPTGHFVVLAYEPSEEPHVVVDSITSIDGVNATFGPEDFDLSDISATALNVVTDPIKGWRNPPDGIAECSPAESPLTNLDWPNYPLLFALDFPGPGAYVLAACRPFRIWVLDVGDTAITVVWTPDDPERFDELAPVADRMVQSMSFESP